MNDEIKDSLALVHFGEIDKEIVMTKSEAAQFAKAYDDITIKQVES